MSATRKTGRIGPANTSSCTIRESCGAPSTSVERRRSPCRSTRAARRRRAPSRRATPRRRAAPPAPAARSSWDGPHPELRLLGLRPARAALVALELLREPSDELVVDLVEDVEAASPRDMTARVPEPCDDGALDHRLHVHVGQTIIGSSRRARAGNPPEGGRRLRRDVLPVPVFTRERDAADQQVRDQRVADLGAAADDDVEHAARRPASWKSSATLSVASGVDEAGLTTTVLPAAARGRASSPSASAGSCRRSPRRGRRAA